MQVNYPPNRFPMLVPQTQPGGLVALGASAPLATLDPPPVTDPATGDAFTDMNPLKQHQELAANALQEGMNMAPAKGGYAEGLARLAQAFVGGKLLNKANTDIATAKSHNSQVMLDAVNAGDWGKLATSDNDQANKLGDSLLSAQLKHMQTERLLTSPEITAAGLPTGTVASKNMNGEIKILNRPNTGLPRGYQYTQAPDGTQTVTFIPGGPADPAIIAKNAGGRAAAVQAVKPKKASTDQSGLAPWLRKW